jgi:hypothetical protein
LVPQSCDLEKFRAINERARAVEIALKDPTLRSRIEHYLNAIWVCFDLQEKEPVAHLTNLWTLLDDLRNRKGREEETGTEGTR